MYDQYGGKKVLRKKKLTSTAITLYTSVSDNVPGNDKRLHYVLAPSAAAVGREDREKYGGDTGLIISDLDRCRARSGSGMPRIGKSSSGTFALRYRSCF